MQNQVWKKMYHSKLLTEMQFKDLEMQFKDLEIYHFNDTRNKHFS